VRVRSGGEGHSAHCSLPRRRLSHVRAQASFAACCVGAKARASGSTCKKVRVGQRVGTNGVSTACNPLKQVWRAANERARAGRGARALLNNAERAWPRCAAHTPRCRTQLGPCSCVVVREYVGRDMTTKANKNSPRHTLADLPVSIALSGRVRTRKGGRG
jgi:hypothetical protein